MLDTFRKRDNLRPAGPGHAGTRAPLSGAHAPNPSPARADSPLAKPVLLDPPAPPAVAEPQPAASAPAASTPAASAVAASPSAQPASAAVTEAPAAVTSSARLIVGPEIKLKGAEITDCDTLMVEGEVDASMDSRVVEIAEQGVFRGKVQVDHAEIRGRFEGELTALKRLVIRNTGRVSGKIRYGKVSIDEGGELCGDIAALDAAGSGARALDLRAARETPAGAAQGAAIK
jgi:cytoskeletal protein CcmA (bactofilin family)